MTSKKSVSIHFFTTAAERLNPADFNENYTWERLQETDNHRLLSGALQQEDLGQAQVF